MSSQSWKILQSSYWLWLQILSRLQEGFLHFSEIFEGKLIKVVTCKVLMSHPVLLLILESSITVSTKNFSQAELHRCNYGLVNSTCFLFFQNCFCYVLIHEGYSKSYASINILKCVPSYTATAEALDGLNCALFLNRYKNMFLIEYFTKYRVELGDYLWKINMA